MLCFSATAARRIPRPPLDFSFTGSAVHLQIWIFFFALRQRLHHDRGGRNFGDISVHILASARPRRGTVQQTQKLRGQFDLQKGSIIIFFIRIHFDWKNPVMKLLSFRLLDFDVNRTIRTALLSFENIIIVIIVVDAAICIVNSLAITEETVLKK